MNWVSRFLTSFLLLIGLVAFSGWYLLYPRADIQPLLDGLVALDTPHGQRLLTSADAKADHTELHQHFLPQILNSFCGIASGVIILNAMGKPTTQRDFFEDHPAKTRTTWRVVLRGTTLEQLRDLLALHGAKTHMVHADTVEFETFKNVLSRNLSQNGDYLIVNYQRNALGQGRKGHVSPIAAYNRADDMVLILDTAANRYPHTWVPVDRLFAGMLANDTESGRSRGYIEISGISAK